MSRKELAAFLNVSAVTIEKWEQQGDRPIRPKYHAQLKELKGKNAALLAAGALAAPTLVLPALLAAGGLQALLGDAELDRAYLMIEKLKRLGPEERETFLKLARKMEGEPESTNDPTND